MPNFTLGDEVFEAAASRFPTPFHLYDEAGYTLSHRVPLMLWTIVNIFFLFLYIAFFLFLQVYL